MRITSETLGTPSQGFVPKGETADIDAGAYTMTDTDGNSYSSKAMTLPSSAGCKDYDTYSATVNEADPGVWGNQDPMNQQCVCDSQALTNAAEQEWVLNPESGHNKDLS